MTGSQTKPLDFRREVVYALRLFLGAQCLFYSAVNPAFLLLKPSPTMPLSNEVPWSELIALTDDLGA